ncbi:MAG: hypothetical protein JW720_02555 [Sedimentisphaerales bacterium]|nr:hypothetical protein [Sedimentisphaerales bacterium]
MKNTQGNILKSAEVTVSGSFKLDAAQPTHAIPPQQTKKHNVPPNARIIENTPEYAVIEITCPCGEKTHLKCDYENNDPDTTQTE